MTEYELFTTYCIVLIVSSAAFGSLITLAITDLFKKKGN
jgi:hypothetical protein